MTEIGDVVTISEDIQVNQSVAKTSGLVGTVLSKKNFGSSNGVASYVYQVSVGEVILEETTSSGTNNTTASNLLFWLTDTQLGGSSTISTGLDQGVLDNSVTNAKGVTSDSSSTTTQLKDSIAVLNQYHDLLTNYDNILKNNLNVLDNFTSLSSNIDQNGNAIVTGSTLLESDATIIKELSQNTFDVYSVVADEESIANQQHQQELQQEALATADDQQNFSTLVNSYINTTEASSLLTPTSGTPVTVKGADAVDSLDGLNPSDLITEALLLEQD